MKKLTQFTFAISLFLVANFPVSAQNRNTASITGSGNVITKTVSTQPYDIISVRGSMEVYLEKGTEGKIQVTAEDNVQEHILVESDGKELIISMKGNTSLRNTKTIKVTVPFENISEVSLLGSGKVEGNDKLKNEALSLNLRGSGEMELTVEASSIDAQLNGSGVMKLSGSANDFKVKTTGSGNFEGKNLNTENTEVYVAGSGNAKVNAKSKLKARIQGSGNVVYSGNPASNDSKVMGSGTIKPI